MGESCGCWSSVSLLFCSALVTRGTLENHHSHLHYGSTYILYMYLNQLFLLSDDFEDCQKEFEIYILQANPFCKIIDEL